MKLLFRGLFFGVMAGIAFSLQANLNQELESLQRHLVVLENALQQVAFEQPPLGVDAKKFDIQFSLPVVNSPQFDNRESVEYSKPIKEAYNQLMFEMKFIIEKMPSFINFLNNNNNPNAVSPIFNEIVGSVNKMSAYQHNFKNALAQIGQTQEIKGKDANELKEYLNSIYNNLNNFYQKYISKVFDYIGENYENKKFAFDGMIANARNHYGKAIYSAPAINEIKKHSYGSNFLLNFLKEVIDDLQDKADIKDEVIDSPFQEVTNVELKKTLEETNSNYDILEKEFNEVKVLLEEFKNDLLKDPFEGNYNSIAREDFVKVYNGVNKINKIIKSLKNNLINLYVLERQTQTPEDVALVPPVIEKIRKIYSQIYTAVNDFYLDNDNKNAMSAIAKINFGGSINTLAHHFNKQVRQDVEVSNLAPGSYSLAELEFIQRNWKDKVGVSK